MSTLFCLSLAIIVQTVTALGQFATRIEAGHLSNGSSYDFVIAGGGIAGLTVADRLTENPNGRYVHPLFRSLDAQIYSHGTGH
jgi:choline dehydrogenase